MLSHTADSRVRVVLVGLVVALVALGGVGLLSIGGGRMRDAADGSPPVADTALSPIGDQATSTTLAGQRPAETAAPTGAKGARADASTATTMPMLVPKGLDDYKYEVTLSPMCVVTGAPLTVTMRLQPGNGASLIIAYADGQSYGSRYQGYAGPDGLLRWTGVAAPVAGTANLLTTATNSEAKTGTTRTEFRVVEAGKSC